MKHLFALLFVFPFCVQAQSPVITRANYFEIGDTALVYLKYDTSVWSISAGAGGANVSWDFSNVNFNHSSVIVDTLLFISPVGTPFYPTYMQADYSQANITMLRKTEPFSPSNFDYNYYFVDNDSLLFLGHWADGGGSELWEDHFDNALKELKFPLQFGDVYVDSFERYFFDMSGSDAHYTKGTFSVNVDGYGSMQTPDGTTLVDVIRVHTVMNATDSSMMGINTYALHKYSWYSESVKGFVLTLNMAYTDSTAVETADYQKQTNVVTGINEKRLGGNVLTIYPNPASDVVTFSLDGVIESIKLYNALGQILKSYNVSKQSSVQFNSNGLVEGMYFVEVMDSNGETHRRKLLVK